MSGLTVLRCDPFGNGAPTREYIAPTTGKLVVSPISTDKVGMIHLPAGHRRPVAGKVLAMGPCTTIKCKLRPEGGKPPEDYWVKEGDTVVFEYAAGNTFDLKQREEVVVLNVEHVLGLVKECADAGHLGSPAPVA